MVVQRDLIPRQPTGSMKHREMSKYLTVCQSVASMLPGSHYQIFPVLSDLTWEKEVFLHEYVVTSGLRAED